MMTGRSMRDQESHAPRAILRREVAAAWICCALAAFAGAFAISSSTTDASRRSAYAGAYLPGRDVIRSLDRRDDDSEDEVEWVAAPLDPAQPLLCSARENPPRATAAKLPDQSPAPSKC
jgi:hypothetical protein